MGDAESGEPSGRRSFNLVDGDSYSDWESVYRDNVLGIYQLVFRRVGNAPDAEDLAEEALVHTLRTLRFPAPVHEVRSYLVKTARTVLADHWRRHYAAPPAALDPELVSSADRVEYAPSAASAERALRILQLLPERFRQVLELRFLRGYSVAEVAAEMNVSQSNAKVIQYRALRRAAELGQELTR
jgi:RNA polymerase sigma-70 factor (ECF subfamily)